MGKTMRSVRSFESGQVREKQQHEGTARWRADRNERLCRASRDAKRIERAERHTAIMDAEPDFRVGSTVRAVA